MKQRLLTKSVNTRYRVIFACLYWKSREFHVVWKVVTLNLFMSVQDNHTKTHGWDSNSAWAPEHKSFVIHSFIHSFVRWLFDWWMDGLIAPTDHLSIRLTGHSSVHSFICSFRFDRMQLYTRWHHKNSLYITIIIVKNLCTILFFLGKMNGIRESRFYEGRSKSFATQYDAQMTQAKFLCYYST